MNNKLRVTVSGYCNSGKSTIARVIAKALREYGVEVKNNDPDSESYSAENSQECLGRLGNEMYVEIDHLQMSRVCSTDTKLVQKLRFPSYENDNQK